MSDHEFAATRPHLEIGWQVYVEALLAEKQRALDAALAAQKEAVNKAETATERIGAQALAAQESMREEMGERLAALRRELESATAAQKEAVLKAEGAAEKRFESVNEWRAQSADRERSQTEERAVLTGSFILREVAEAQFATIAAKLEALQRVVDKTFGTQAGREASSLDWRTVVLAVLVIAAALIGPHIK